MWDELIFCLGPEMVVQGFEWEWIFYIVVVEAMVVVDVDGSKARTKGATNIEEKKGNIMDFFHNIFANLVTKIDFEDGMAKVSKIMGYSNYFGTIEYKLEIFGKDIAPCVIEKATKVFLEPHFQVFDFFAIFLVKCSQSW